MDVLAIDMGSSQVRGYLAHREAPGFPVKLKEIYRQPHQVTQSAAGRVTWEVERLVEQGIQAVKAAIAELGCPPDGIAIDGWGVDAVLVDPCGQACGEALAYRDESGARGRTAYAGLLPERQQFTRTGVFPQDINTLYRYRLLTGQDICFPVDEGEGAPSPLNQDDPSSPVNEGKLCPSPDSEEASSFPVNESDPSPSSGNTDTSSYLFPVDEGGHPSSPQLMFLADYVLRRIAQAEILGWPGAFDPGAWASQGVASTSGMVQAGSCSWDRELVELSGAASSYLPPLKPELSVIGQRGKTQLILAGSHDTACAVYGMAVKVGGLFISCGSWAVIGALTEQPILSDQAYELGLTNEAATDGYNRAEINLTGMWIAQECRRHWERVGLETSFAHLDRLTLEAEAPKLLIDPNDPAFAAPGEMPIRLAEAIAAKGGQLDPNDQGAVLRLVTTSLAASIIRGIKELQSLSHGDGQITIVGGGTKDALLMQLLRQEFGSRLQLGPGEASVLGNALAQLTVLDHTEASTGKDTGIEG